MNIVDVSRAEALAMSVALCGSRTQEQDARPTDLADILCALEVLPSSVRGDRTGRKVILLIRGLPGAGKNTLGAALSATFALPEPRSADDFFCGPDGFVYNPAKSAQAHAACLLGAAEDLAADGVAIVANTFCKGWEVNPYLALSIVTDADLVVIDLFDAGLVDEALAVWTKHGVPVQTIAAMRAAYEEDWAHSMNYAY